MLPAAQLSGAIPSANLVGTYFGTVTFSSAANSFAGDGSGLTGLNASQLTSGTVPDAQLSGNVALRTGGNIFTGTQVITGGALGVGTNSPAATVHVFGSQLFRAVKVETADPLGTWLNLANTSTNGRGWSIISSGPSNGEGPGQLLFHNNVNPNLSPGTTRLVLNTNGHLGLGTTVPKRQLHNTGEYYGLGHFYLHAFEGDSASGTAYLQARDDSGASSINLRLRTQLAGNFVDALTINSNGHVGVGTNAPAATFHVRGNQQFRAAKIETADPVGTWLNLANTATNGRGWSLISSGPANGEGPGHLLFHNNPNPNTVPGSTRMVLSTNGYLGVGVVAPDFPLHVGAGGARFEQASGEWVEIRLQGNGVTEPFKLIDTSSDAYLSLGGAWVSSSDREKKENFQPVDAQAVLEKVAALPLSEWNYKATPGTRHVGPMAQDFHAAFGVGPDDKHIAGVDADGVVLAAIQGLNKKLEEKLEQKETEIAALQARLANLEKLIADFGSKGN